MAILILNKSQYNTLATKGFGFSPFFHAALLWTIRTLVIHGCCYFYLRLQLHLVFERWRSQGRCNNSHESAAINSCHLTKDAYACVCIYIYMILTEEEIDTRICSLPPDNLPLCYTKLWLSLEAQSSLAMYPWTQVVDTYIRSLSTFCFFSAAWPQPKPRRKCSCWREEMMGCSVREESVGRDCWGNN